MRGKLTNIQSRNKILSKKKKKNNNNNNSINKIMRNTAMCSNHCWTNHKVDYKRRFLAQPPNQASYNVNIILRMALSLDRIGKEKNNIMFA